MMMMMMMVNDSSRWSMHSRIALWWLRDRLLSLSRSSPAFCHSPPRLCLFWHCFYVTASYDAIIDLSKKQNTLCQKKRRRKTKTTKGFKAIPTRTGRESPLGVKKKCGKFGNAHWCALRCEIVTIVQAIVSPAMAHCMVGNSRKEGNSTGYLSHRVSRVDSIKRSHRAYECIHSAIDSSRNTVRSPLVCLPHPLEKKVGVYLG